MIRTHSLALLFALAIHPLFATRLLADMGPDPHYKRARDVVDSATLSKEQKVEAIREVFLDTDHSSEALITWIMQVDEGAARDEALKIFRDKGAPRAERLGAGRMLLTRLKAEGFANEYGPVLVALVLDGGLDEFMQVHVQSDRTAVGEYAFIASGFEGMLSAHFGAIADARVAPVLVKCLDAPNHVSAGRDCTGEAPGEATQRNTQRQQIPVALARLKAAEAVADLQRVVKTHHDYWERFHAAYAVGLMGSPKSVADVENFLVAKSDENDNRLILFGLGKGMVERGSGEGMKYLAFKYSTYFGKDDAQSALCMLKERLDAVKDFKGTEAESLYREALTYPPLRGLFLFDPAAVTVPKGLMRVTPDRKSTVPVTTPQGVLDYAEPDICFVYMEIGRGISSRRIHSLEGVIRDIGESTKNDTIRGTSQETLRLLKQ